MPTTKHHKSVAASVAAPTELIPVLPQLFSNVQSLGSMPGPVVRMLLAAHSRPTWRFLDLGCGKGSVSIAIAATHPRAKVTGIDAFAPFIASAQSAAANAGLSSRCTFKLGDVAALEHSRIHTRYDAAVMLNLFECGRAAPLLHRWVRPGGVYLLDDAFRSPTAPPRFANVPTRDECREAIEHTGDRVEQEFVPTPSQVRAVTTRLLGALQAATPRISREHPELRRPLNHYLEEVRASSRVLGKWLRPAIWLVRRA